MRRKESIQINGYIRSAGVTIYSKNGRNIMRAATSAQPHRRTAKQFEMRELLAHNNALWRSLHNILLMEREQFFLLAAKLPPLYLTRGEHISGYTLLMPGIPVSCGTLPDIDCRLGSVDGTPALLTNLDPTLLSVYDRLRLVVVEQLAFPGQLKLVGMAEEVNSYETVGGHVALVGERYGDPRFGWALVRTRRKSCSTQRVVTAATAYSEYLGPEARQRAADSYGGLTEG